MSTADEARRLAEELLFPEANLIDAAPVVPRRYLDAIAEAGLYSLPEDRTQAGRVIESLAGASLATTFVWIQHHSAVRAVAAAGGELADEWLEGLRSGGRRAGIAYAALRRPGPPSAVAELSALGDGGWLLSGFAPWVTGWGLVDIVLAGARRGDDIVWLLIDADCRVGQEVKRVRLAALDASATVRLTWDRLEVPSKRVVGVEAYEDWRRRDLAGMASNGHLAVGVAARCATLLGSQALDAEVGAIRRRLDRSGPSELASARADASILALRAAAAVSVAGGGRSVEADATAARLMREATFLLVFGQTSDIRAHQTADLGL
ncbi:MAG: acyl-CoA dehydrogenase family protein [Acidimicrobiales bacterium]